MAAWGLSQRRFQERTADTQDERLTDHAKVRRFWTNEQAADEL
jgi:hypothetical protein